MNSPKKNLLFIAECSSFFIASKYRGLSGQNGRAINCKTATKPVIPNIKFHPLALPNNWNEIQLELHGQGKISYGIAELNVIWKAF